MTAPPTRVCALAGGTIVATESARSEATPDAAPVVALHGWARDRHDFDPIHGLGSVLAVDLPGHGASPPPERPGGAHHYAALLATALDDHGVRDAVVVGHSFGGRVGLCLATDRPDLVGALLLTGVPLLRTASGSRPALGMRLAKRARAIGLIGEDRLERVRHRYGSADYRAADGVMRDVLVRVVNEDYGAELSALNRPVSMVWGTDDTAAPVAMARRAWAMVSSPVEFVELPGGHFAHREHSERFMEVIDRLRKLVR